MRRIAAFGLGILLLTSATGCFCRCCTDHYGDLIDEISDHDLELDCLYCPALDLTRIGFPDWCECPVNRALDPQKCACNLPYYGPRNRTLAAYYYNSSFQHQAPAAAPAVPPAPAEDEKIDLPPEPATSGIDRSSR